MSMKPSDRSAAATSLTGARPRVPRGPAPA
jgi:hypothetical protein